MSVSKFGRYYIAFLFPVLLCVSCDKVENNIKYLNDHTSLSMQLRCITNLGEFGDAKAIDPLVAHLKDSGWLVRVHVIRALIKLGSLSAVDKLTIYLADSIPDVRMATLEFLVKTGRGRLFQQQIISLLNDESWMLRREAFFAIKRTSGKKMKELLRAKIDFLPSKNLENRELLIRYISSQTVEDRNKVLALLKKQGDQFAVDSLGILAITSMDMEIKKNPQSYWPTVTTLPSFNL